MTCRHTRPAQPGGGAGLSRDRYFTRLTAEASRLAAGSTVAVAEAVMTGAARNGVAVVRPPGHHAEPEKMMGFCILNNVAVAARAAIDRMGARRVMVVDWDVHHGNGGQAAFLDSPEVLHCSVHRHDMVTVEEDGTPCDPYRFYPGTDDGGPHVVGVGAGAGFTANIGWESPGAGDAEYAEAFNRLVLPLGMAFQPDLILVAAGFDAVAGDPLGGGHVTPAGFAALTRALRPLADGRIVLVLEGGYETALIAQCMVECTSALLEPPPPPAPVPTPAPADPLALSAIAKSRAALAPFWPALARDDGFAAAAPATPPRAAPHDHAAFSPLSPDFAGAGSAAPHRFGVTELLTSLLSPITAPTRVVRGILS